MIRDGGKCARQLCFPFNDNPVHATYWPPLRYSIYECFLQGKGRSRNRLVGESEHVSHQKLLEMNPQMPLRINLLFPSWRT